ncbi:hypothetical protein VTK26DRAFT_7639 [Humicola hyalothermophila]
MMGHTTNSYKIIQTLDYRCANGNTMILKVAALRIARLQWATRQDQVKHRQRNSQARNPQNTGTSSF